MSVKNLASRALGALRAAREDRRGVVAIMTAVMAPVLVGALAVAVDTAYWRSRTYYLQAAADSAAIAASLDLNNGLTGTANTARIVANSTIEARRMCGTCTVTVNYPYSGDVNKVRIQVTDTNASRFFSGIYDARQRTLQASAIAQRGGGTTTTKSGSACVLALSYAEQGNGSGIYMQNPGASIGPSECEVISNNTGGASAYVDANAVVNAPLTVSGAVRFQNGGRATGTVKTYQAATPDPYAGKVVLNRSAMNLTRSYNTSGPFACYGRWTDPWNVQRASIYANGDASNPAVGSNNNAVSSSQDRMNGGQFRWSDTDGSWHFVQDFSPDGVRAWFCEGLELRNTTVTLDPGLYIISKDVNWSNVTLKGNGATILFADDIQNVNWQNSTLDLVAPPAGVPSDASRGVAGIVLTQFTSDSSRRAFELSTNITLNFTGAIYIPTKTFRVQNTGRLLAMPLNGGVGCGHVIVAGILILNNVNLGNNCTVPMGVQPFGTIENQGWYSSTSSSGGGGAARLIQ